MARRTRDRRPRRSARAPGGTRRWGLAIFLIAVFAIKLVVLLQLRDHPLLSPDAGLDSGSYAALAARVRGGDFALGPGLYYLSPLYIYFLAAVLFVTDSLTAVRIVQALLGTGAVAAVFVAARAWFGDRAAWIAAALAALTGVFTFYEILILQSSLDVVLTATGLALLATAFRLKAEATGSDGTAAFRLEAEATGSSNLVASAFRRKILLAGVVFGLQILNRPNVGIAIAGLALALIVMRQWRTAVLLTMGVVFALSPIVARNLLVSHQLALVSSQGGLNFYIGNHPAATGQYVAMPGIRANIEGQAEDTRLVAEHAAGHSLTDAEVSSYFAGLAVDWMSGHPLDALRLFGRKLALVFNARHQWLDFSYPYYAYDTGSLLRWLFVGPWLLVPLGLAGLVAAPPALRRPEYFAWSSFAFWYALGVAAFFVGERYRLPLFVPLCVGAGGALDRLASAIGTAASPTSRRRLAAIGAVAAAGVVVAAWPFGLPDGRFQERLRLSKVLMNRGDYGGAVSELEAALALTADSTTEFNLGVALVSNGRAAEGLAHMRRAVDAGVPIPGARYALAGALLTTGDRDAAVALLRTFFPDPAESAESCYRVGVLAMNAGAPLVAERYLQRALQLRPGWPEAQEALAQLRGRVP